jgi:hypothetical protein
MTTYSPDFTSRYRCKYHVCGIDHTIQLRRASGATPGDTATLAATVSAVFSAVSAKLCTDFAFLSAEQADEGSDIFYPSTLPAAVTGTSGSPGTYTPFQKITHTRWNCRAPGSRSSIELYGLFWEFSNNLDDIETVAYDGVLTAADYAPVATVAGLLNSQAFANSGNPASVWASRALVKVNDFWLKAVRSGGVT